MEVRRLTLSMNRMQHTALTEHAGREYVHGVRSTTSAPAEHAGREVVHGERPTTSDPTEHVGRNVVNGVRPTTTARQTWKKAACIFQH